MADVFVSYTRQDVDFTGALARALEAQGLSVWYDAAIGGGAEWRASIVDAMQQARLVVLVYSPATEKSAEVAKELAVAAAQKRRIVPIRVANVFPSGAFLYEMARLNWVDCFPVTEARLETIALALGEMIRAGADARAAESFHAAVGARYIGQGAWSRLSRNSLALVLVMLALSIASFAAYDRATSYLREQAAAGVPPLVSLRNGALIVTVGAPLLLLQSLSHLDRPWTWPVVLLAAANCAAFLFAARNVIGWISRRAGMAWAARRPTGART